MDDASTQAERPEAASVDPLYRTNVPELEDPHIAGLPSLVRGYPERSLVGDGGSPRQGRDGGRFTYWEGRITAVAPLDEPFHP